jgi:uncharacterized membrane protein YgcG
LNASFKALLQAVSASLLIVCGVPHAAELIEEFSSDIRVHADGGMLVSERIRVRAEGRQIRRGIFRDFPTDYKDARGNAYRVDFDVVSVTRDGADEAFHTQRQDNGVRVYVGREDIFIAPGVYDYVITYRTNRQLGFFDDHDELYWNVTGNGWAFPIQVARAAVTLPAGVPADTLRVEAYTGPQGARGQQYRAGVEATGVANFTTTQALAPYEGLTIVVAWPKGFITEPDATQKLGFLLRDNLNLLVGTIGLAAVLAYYLMVWRAVGRDPETGVVIPHYQPPVGYSPASARYIRRMDYDNKTFAAAVVNLAVKNALTITEDDGEFTLLRKNADGIELAPGEGALYRKLFAGSDIFILKTANHKRVSAAIKAHRNSLSRDYEKIYFNANRLWLVPGLLVSIPTLIGYLYLSHRPERDMPAMFVTGIVLFMIWRAYQAMRRASLWASVRMLLPMVVALGGMFFVGEQFLAAAPELLLSALPWGGVALAGVMVLINIAFYQLLKAPTLAGRRLLDRLAGFREYLQVAEQDELNLKNPPRMTPQLFETYLPFALALDVEQQWGERFAREFENLQDSDHYQPSWYRGRRWDSHGVTGMSRALGGSLTSAISSSSTAPGSSSGSGGGGSSGGGGGGGGGGGW